MATVTTPIHLQTSSHRPRQISDKRRDKKRVADRLCQRQARARTKNKIAELEALVAHLTSQSGNEIYKELKDELEKSRAESSSLRRKLATIASIARIGDEGPVKAAYHTPRNDDADISLEQDISISAADDLEVHDESAAHQGGNACEIHGNFDTNFPGAEGSTFNFLGGILDVDTLNQTGFAASFPSPLTPQADTFGSASSFAPPATTSIDLSFPESRSSCSCVPRTESNMWSSMSQTLMDWKDQQRPGLKPGENHDDIAVRAVTEGWDAPSLGTLSVPWRILSQVDRKVWANCRPVDRLAVLSIMNMLLQKHAYAIDFFVWPGIRERFIYHQHKYCSDKFWSLLAQHFRFVWPYDLRDCYAHNRSTGRYQLSDLFRRHLNDLSSFTFCHDMFNSFPEFECDIPKYMTIPRSLECDPHVEIGRGPETPSLVGTRAQWPYFIPGEVEPDDMAEGSGHTIVPWAPQLQVPSRHFSY
ncbi:hypothetical protein A1O7_02113 [Cladophialophora yegresii CBS 114405]|uniref:BZIP domain-containing protein n=1 Tax=Cladophialophora yegresii CBS 114405 TaxID=1182544 RepID=W9WTM3_9EURO|nr:uncharacterized protein A1O7_02113 [Cladophialophora yegresii CBS 114405]EXJ61684.1 hypothetical protein A1O7_02113 [Cladophialophora yegresii CBS 114405]